MDYKERRELNKQKILSVCPNAKDESGIYFLIRVSNGFKFAYIGQSVKMLTRLAQHLEGFEQHIDRSIRAHGLYSEENTEGWTVNCLPFPESQLDDKERYYIRLYANNGFQLRNKTLGGQDDKKVGIAPNKPSKGYFDGKKQGYEDCRKFVVSFFEKNLDFTIKGDTNKNKEKAFIKFQNFLKGE